MKLVEVGTFILLVLFIAGMTVKHQEQIQIDKQRVEDYYKGLELEVALAETEANTETVIINHDRDLSTNSVFVTLSADGFDGGNAAQYLFVTRDVDNESKPRCDKWSDSKTCEDPSDIYDADYFSDCCEIPLLDECGKQTYEPACAEYEEGCDVLNNLDDCFCIKDRQETVEYVKDCDYRKGDYSEKKDYVTGGMRGRLVEDKDLTYSWERVTGPEPVFSSDMEDASVTMELVQGKYVFKCIVVDPYGYQTSISKNVTVKPEPNNKPEISLGASRSNPADEAALKEAYKKAKEAEAKKEAAEAGE